MKKRLFIIFTILIVLLFAGASILIIKNSTEKTNTSSTYYKVTTNTKWITMENDGGSHTNIYYEIDINKKTIKKTEERYEANLGKTPKTTKKTIYTKTIDKKLSNKSKKLLDSLLNKKDKKGNNYSFITIETKEYNKNIYNESSIKLVDKLLNEFDKK